MLNEKKAMKVLDGLILGDGGLVRFRTGVYYAMSLSKPLVPRKDDTELIREISLVEHIKYEQWLVENVFEPLSIPICKGHPRVVTTTSHGRPYKAATLTTGQSSILTNLYEEHYAGGEWVRKGANVYVRGARKIFPARILRSPALEVATLTHLFIGDGISYWHPWPRPQIGLSVMGYSEGEVQYLVKVLSDMGVVTTKLSKDKSVVCGSGLTILIAQCSVNHFLDVVEPGILEIFKDSRSPSYKDMIKRKPDLKLDPTLNNLKVALQVHLKMLSGEGNASLCC